MMPVDWTSAVVPKVHGAEREAASLPIWATEDFICPYGCQETSMITTLDDVVRRRGCPSCSGLRVVSESLGSSSSARPLTISDKDSVKLGCTVREQG